MMETCGRWALFVRGSLNTEVNTCFLGIARRYVPGGRLSSTGDCRVVEYL